MTTIIIDPRFRGPPNSGNGGYVCGIVAAAAREPVAVRLRRPPPLQLPLSLVEVDGSLRLVQGDDVIAEARPSAVDIEVPLPPEHAEAAIASIGYAGFVDHPFAGCFVCGPKRGLRDGLRIFPGPLSGRPLVAALWTPDETLAGPDGTVRPEFVWAALDCPGYFATPMAGQPALLGELDACIERPLRPGEPCVVLGWERSSEGRKHFAGTAVFGPDGDLVAKAAATWIAIATVDRGAHLTDAVSSPWGGDAT